jgi:O-antigen ligase
MNLSVNQVHFFLMICYAFSLPFNAPYPKLSNVLMLLMAANWIRVHRLSFKSATLIVTVLFFILHLIGLLHTQNIDQGIFELDKKIGFLIFPIVFSAFDVDKDQVRKALTAFALGTIAASLICLIYACWQYLLYGNSDYFYYHPLTEIIDMHAIYMAMYVSFTFFILIYYYSRAALTGSVKIKGLYIFCLLYLTFFLFLLSARTIIFGFSVIVFSGILVYGYRKKKPVKAALVLTVLVGLFSALIFLNDNNKERFKEAINYNSQYTIDKQYGGRSTRELIWHCAVLVIQQNPLFGSGTGDAQDVLHECYLQNDYGPLTYLPDLKYNAHSQYLQSFIDLGLPGLLIFLLMLFIPFVQSIKRRDYLLLWFIGLFSLACITESMLELKQGIAFFAFFQCLLIQRQTQRNALAPAS